MTISDLTIANKSVFHGLHFLILSARMSAMDPQLTQKCDGADECAESVLRALYSYLRVTDSGEEVGSKTYSRKKAAKTGRPVFFYEAS